MLKDLTAEVKRLKCEEKSLVEESRDVIINFYVLHSLSDLMDYIF